MIFKSLERSRFCNTTSFFGEETIILYEKLDKMRAKFERARQCRTDADTKVKTLEAKLKEAEND